MYTNTKPITETAMLATLAVSQYSGRKFDPQASAELNSTKGASGDAARVNLALLPKEALAGVAKAVSAARAAHYRMTLPYGDVDGVRILAAKLFFEHSEAMRQAKEAFTQEADEFEQRYPRYLADAAARMNGLYRPEFYPSASAVRGLFRFDVAYDAIPEPQGMRAELFGGSDAERARIVAEAEARRDAHIRAAVGDVWRRVYDVVAHAAERLTVYERDANGKTSNPFRDTLISNVGELVAILPALNITGDAALDDLTRRLTDTLAAADVERLRADDGYRAAMRDEADDILAVMSAYTGGVR